VSQRLARRPPTEHHPATESQGDGAEERWTKTRSIHQSEHPLIETIEREICVPAFSLAMAGCSGQGVRLRILNREGLANRVPYEILRGRGGDVLFPVLRAPGDPMFDGVQMEVIHKTYKVTSRISADITFSRCVQLGGLSGAVLG
jgi:hypothetical protein